MDQNDSYTGGGTAGPANTPNFGGSTGAGRTGTDHQIPDTTTPAHNAPLGSTGGIGGGSGLGAGSTGLGGTSTGMGSGSLGGSSTGGASTGGSTGGSSGDSGGSSGGSSGGGQLSEKANQALGQVEERVNQALPQAADRLEQVAGRIDTLADQRLSGSGAAGRAGDMAHTVADTMESVASYLRNNDAQGLRTDLETQVRNKPLQTLLIGVAAGWLVGKILR